MHGSNGGSKTIKFFYGIGSKGVARSFILSFQINREKVGFFISSDDGFTFEQKKQGFGPHVGDWTTGTEDFNFWDPLGPVPVVTD